MSDQLEPGQRVRLLVDCGEANAGQRGTVRQTAHWLGVAFDGLEGVIITHAGRPILDFVETIPDDRLVQLSFDWWLNFGDWKGERGDPDDF